MVINDLLPTDEFGSFLVDLVLAVLLQKFDCIFQYLTISIIFCLL